MKQFAITVSALLLASTLFLTGCQQANGGNKATSVYYVGGAGASDDDNDGSEGKPFKTVQRAVDFISANGVADGTINVTGTVPAGVASADTCINIVKPVGALTVHIKGTNNATIDAEQKARVLTVSGAGVQVTMENITLKGGKTTRDGGGVLIADGATFTMVGGSIMGNSAKSESGPGVSGGGVYIQGAHFNMQGGKVINNKVGGGVYIASDSTMNISGDVTISDNEGTSVEDNVFLGLTALGKPLKVVGALDGSGKIMVHTAPGSDYIATGLGYTITAADKDKFVYDGGGNTCTLDTATNSIKRQ